MAQSIQALREQIAARAREIKTLVEDKNTTWGAEQQEKYDAGLAEIEAHERERTRRCTAGDRPSEVWA